MAVVFGLDFWLEIGSFSAYTKRIEFAFLRTSQYIYTISCDKQEWSVRTLWVLGEGSELNKAQNKTKQSYWCCCFFITAYAILN